MSHWRCLLLGHAYELVYEAKKFGVFLCPRCGNGFTLHTAMIAKRIEAKETEQ